MTDAVATAAGIPIGVVRRAAMLSGDLGRTAALALTEGQDALEAVRLAVLHPIQPMLAASAADVTEALGHTGLASVEWKLDGARVQVHRLDDEVRIYTRNLNDITDRLAGVVALARELPVTSVVLDGEVLGVHEDATPQAFQDTMSAFGRDGASGAAARLLVRFFDILHRDGVDLIDEPLDARLRHLDEVVGELAIPRVSTADPAEAQALLDDALAKGHEGAMVKALDSTYDAGRRGGSWRKVKPVKTLDLVVLAVEWGSGRRQGWLSNLHLGARDPDGGFVMVGKTFKGMTDELLAWQTEALLERETHRDGHTVFVRPGAGRGDRARRRADEPPLPGRRGAALRPGAGATAPTRTPRTPTSSPPCRRCGPGLRRRSSSARASACVAAGGAARTGGSCTSGSSAGLGAGATRACRGPGALLSVAALGGRGLAGLGPGGPVVLRHLPRAGALAVGRLAATGRGRDDRGRTTRSTSPGPGPDG